MSNLQLVDFFFLNFLKRHIYIYIYNNDFFLDSVVILTLNKCKNYDFFLLDNVIAGILFTLFLKRKKQIELILLFLS